MKLSNFLRAFLLPSYLPILLTGSKCFGLLQADHITDHDNGRMPESLITAGTHQVLDFAGYLSLLG